MTNLLAQPLPILEPSADLPLPEAPPAAVSVARGDGIGPEITDAVLRVLDAAGAGLAVDEVEVGERAYRRGAKAGIESETWARLRASGVLLKGPITTPQGGGYKSVNVTLRKTLGLYANVRPCRSYAPWVETRHPELDLVIVRENEEDTYGGIEHRQTREVVQCLKLISRPGCERIVRHAFELARREGRRKVTCMTKDNIMKATDGLFHRVFDEIAADYPEIENEHLIIDIGTARLADRPEQFDVVVTPNLYGDILSDVAAQISGSVGLAGSGNYGEEFAMFEAVHGSAPDIAGRDLANPSGLLLAATMLLEHFGQAAAAGRIRDAWLRTLEDGIHTADVFRPERSRLRVGTRAFATAVIERLGLAPRELAASRPTRPVRVAAPASRRTAPEVKQLVGVDVFFDWDRPGRDPEALARELAEHTTAAFRLTMISNRGVKVWPHGRPETFRTDHWRCRFQAAPGEPAEVSHRAVAELLSSFAAGGLDFVKTEHLYTFDGAPGFSLGQGE
jgi:isocitrate dehydrogenase